MFYFKWRCWWGVGEVVVNWSKNANTMCFSSSCSVSSIQRHAFQERRSLSDYHKNYFQYIHMLLTYNWWYKHNQSYNPWYLTNLGIEGTFILGPLFFKWIVVFKSLLKSFSIARIGIYSKYFLTSSLVFKCWCPFFTIFKFSSLQVLANSLAYFFWSAPN